MRAAAPPRMTPDEAGDLEATEIGQRGERPGVRRAPVALDGRRDHRDLVPPRVVVEPGPAARRVLGGYAGERCHERRRRGRVADAHLADADDVDATTPEPLDRAQAHLDRSTGLPVGHRRHDREVRGAVRDACADQPSPAATPSRGRKVRGDADIDDGDPGAHLAREDVDGRAARHEVRDHHRRHGGGIRRDAADGDPVVGGEDHDVPSIEGRIRTPGDPRQPDDQLLEPAEAPGGLGELIEVRLGVRHRGRVRTAERVDDGQRVGEAIGHGRPRFSVIGRPAMTTWTSSAAAANRWWTRPARFSEGATGGVHGHHPEAHLIAHDDDRRPGAARSTPARRPPVRRAAGRCRRARRPPAR